MFKRDSILKTYFNSSKWSLHFRLCLTSSLELIAKGGTNPLALKFLSIYGINCCMSSWKPTRVDVPKNLHLPQTQIETRSWTCFGWAKLRNSNFVISIIVSSHFPSMVNNINPFFVVLGTPKKPWFKNLSLWMTNIIMNTTHWINDGICYMTISTLFGMEV